MKTITLWARRKVLSNNDLSIMLDEENNNLLTGDAVKRFVNEVNYKGEQLHQDMLNISNIVKSIQMNKLEFQKPEAFYIREPDVSKPKATTR